MNAGPSEHLSWNELACWNRRPTPFTDVRTYQPGELVAPYPAAWRTTRAQELAETFEDIRRLLGDYPLHINSAYRTINYNALQFGAAHASQHPQGRALDLRHALLPPDRLCSAILELQRAGKLPRLGGLGKYPTFVHIDVRPKVAGRLSRW